MAPATIFELSIQDTLLDPKHDPASVYGPGFLVYHRSFKDLIGQRPSLQCVLVDTYPFAHEAGIYVPEQDAVYVTSNQFKATESGQTTIALSKLTRDRANVWKKEGIEPEGLVMPNGGINDPNKGMVLCMQGDHSTSGGLVFVDTDAPYGLLPLITSYHGRRFNSVNDVVVKSDGSYWFTDPIYGSEQGICPKPSLPNQVYRFHHPSKSIRAVADGFGRPNGLCFSPDEKTLYVTDTDWIHGDGTTDDTRASTIYAFDVIQRSGGDFLANRRLFAMADTGIPDGIKCDTFGNVYSGCGDGVNVWDPAGTLIGKILIPGGVANFCFGRSGELFLLNETMFWVAEISLNVGGALLKGMGIDCDRN